MVLCGAVVYVVVVVVAAVLRGRIARRGDVAGVCAGAYVVLFICN